ncbi:Crp/Fnr family transcriptional regulator [Clostridia bacterium]|nr:Crp/Fnr family transcriptional regulator [Clostridia bacterium]
MNQILDDLENSVLLQSLPPSLVKEYIQSGRFQIASYSKDQILHMEGDICTQLEIVIKGSIAIERIDKSGGLLTVILFESGKLLGANLVFSNEPNYPMTVTAKANSTVLCIKKGLAFELLSIYPKFLLTFLELISVQSVQLGTKIKHHVRRTIREAIISYLEQEYLQQGDTTIHLNLSKKALAERMGVSRTSLSRELQKMKLDKLIDYDRHSIRMLDLRRLGLSKTR